MKGMRQFNTHLGWLPNHRRVIAAPQTELARWEPLIERAHLEKSWPKKVQVTVLLVILHRIDHTIHVGLIENDILAG